MLTNSYYSRARAPRGVERPQRIERTQRILPHQPQDRSLTRKFFDEGDQHEVDQEWEEDVANTKAANDPERLFSSFDRVPKRHGPRRIAAAAFLLVGAGFLWHYRQGVREVVSNRFFSEPTGGSVTAASPGAQPLLTKRATEGELQAPPPERTSQSPSGASSGYVAPAGRFRQPGSSSQRGAAAFDQGPQPIPAPEATAPVPVVPVAAATPPAERAESASLPVDDRPKALGGSTSAGAISKRAVAENVRSPSRPRAPEVSRAKRPSQAKRGYVWSPSAEALVPAGEAGASTPSPSAVPSGQSLPASPPANGRTGISPDDTLAPSLTNAPAPSAAAATNAPKEAPPSPAERRSEEPPPKTIASPSLGSPPVIAPARTAPEPDERPVTPTEPPPFK